MSTYRCRRDERWPWWAAALPPRKPARGAGPSAPLPPSPPVGAGSGSAGSLLRAALSLRLTDLGLMGRAKRVRRAAGAGAASSVGVRVLAGGAVGVRSAGFSRLGALGIGARCVVKSFALREYFRFVVLQFMRQRRGRPVHVRCRPPRDRGLRVATAPLPCLPGAAESVGKSSGRERSGRITPLAANGE